MQACGSRDVAPVAEPDPLNIVFIMSDTHRWGAMLMTGRWPHQQGLLANHMNLAERVDLPEPERTRGTVSWAFKEAGYTTAHIGKWHLGGHDARPFGFDRSIVWSGTNDHRRSDYSIDGAPLTEWTGTSNATAMTSQALEWMETVHDDGRPFFVILSLNPPHGPVDDAPDEFTSLYPDEEALPFHPLDQLRNWADHRNYHALVSNDESTRVPFLVRGPGIPAGLALDTLASTIDLFPTLAGLAGLPSRLRDAGTVGSAASLAYLDSLPGVDLSSHLRNEPRGLASSSVFLMHPTNMNNRFSRPELVWRAVVTDRYTYAVTSDGEYALWDNDEAYQTTNLVTDPETLPIRTQLWEELGGWMSPSLTDDHNWPRQRGFDRFYGTLTGGGTFFNPSTLILDDTPARAEGPDYHYTDAISDRAIGFLDDLSSASNTNPFFLYVAYTAPHWPLHAWPEDVARHTGT